MAAEIKDFEDIYKRLRRLDYYDIDISLIIGIVPYPPQRHLGSKAAGLPLPAIVGIFRHLTFQGEPILLKYPTEQAMLKAKETFEQLCGDIQSKNPVGWLNGKSDFTLALD